MMVHVKEMFSLVILNVYARLVFWDQVVNEVFFMKKGAFFLNTDLCI
jgi:hypothetical protein